MSRIATIATESGQHVTRKQRVRIAPHTDAWMRGERYGHIITIGPKHVTVRSDAERLHRFPVKIVDGAPQCDEVLPL